MKKKELKILAVPKPRMTRADTWKKRPCVVKYWAYKDELRWLFEKEDIKIDGRIFIDFYIPMPRSWSKKKKKELDGKFHDKRPDIDNLVKGVMDALYEEDSHIHTICCKKYWSVEPKMIIYQDTI